MNTISVTGQLLGPVSFGRDGRAVSLPPASAALFAFLLVHSGRPVERDQLLAVLGEGAVDHARRRLNTAVWRLRRALEPDGVPRDTILESTGHTLSVHPDCEVWVDALEFESRCTSVVPLAQWSHAQAAEVESALELYRGEFMDGDYSDWALAERGRLADLRLSSLLRLSRWYQAHGEPERALGHAQTAVASEPLREDLHRLLIDLYARVGLPEMARRQFERCRTLLRRELGIEPLPETVATAMRAERGRDADGEPVLDADRYAAIVLELERSREELRRIETRIARSLRALRSGDTRPQPSR